MLPEVAGIAVNSTGASGEGTVKRRYALVMNDRFIHETNITTYPPQEKNKAGEVHEHSGVFSFDKARRTIVLRQFHVEGCVNQYVATVATLDGEVLSLESEATENVPGGGRALRPEVVGLADMRVDVDDLVGSPVP